VACTAAGITYSSEIKNIDKVPNKKVCNMRFQEGKYGTKSLMTL
jgi:hypothetical protein